MKASIEGAWSPGAVGEMVLRPRLDRFASGRFAVLHDRRLPGTRLTVDHLVVTGAGVVVIDERRYVDQRPELRVAGGLLRPRVERLMIGGGDRSALVDGVLRQVAQVRTALGDDSIDVAGVLCLVDADWPLVAGSFSTRGVRVVAPCRLTRLLDQATGTVDVAGVQDRLARALPPA